MLDFRIETFLTVCETLNFTKAAAILGLTQPAVSQHIHYLEEKYETKLFYFYGKKMKCSEAGVLLRQSMLTFQNDEKQMKLEMKNTLHKNQPLLFGTTLTIGEFVLAKPLAHYIATHPEQNIHVTIANTRDLLQKLSHGEIHFALVEGYFDQANFDSLFYRSEPFVPVCCASHSFSKKICSLKDLKKERLLLREQGSGSRDIFEKSLTLQDLTISDFSHIVEINSMYAILQLLKEDCGISFLYEAAVKKELEMTSLKVIPVPDYHIHHDFTFIWNKGSIYAEKYIELCNLLVQ